MDPVSAHFCSLRSAWISSTADLNLFTVSPEYSGTVIAPFHCSDMTTIPKEVGGSGALQISLQQGKIFHLPQVYDSSTVPIIVFFLLTFCIVKM
ncbi:hypothetical protein BPOR_0199g00140 [Botrytis porri]|uniref:Uncharacterized protein n=1 Tax=Botrytis porri TaxID=87229 RepID=A0A4Z1KP78_9HELO|nr:hypothetical protein BPOR_0199g00140 [Botrytis porri]